MHETSPSNCYLEPVVTDPFLDKECLFFCHVFDKCDHSPGEMKLGDLMMRLTPDSNLTINKLISHIQKDGCPLQDIALNAEHVSFIPS